MATLAAAVNQTDKFASVIEPIAGAMGRLSSSIQLVHKIVDQIGQVSDQYLQMGLQLGLIHDGTTSMAQLQDQVAVAALRSRSDYQQTVAAAATLGTAGGAVFNDNTELLGFVEQLNKHLTISVTAPQESSVIIEQLSQALGAGTMNAAQLNSMLVRTPTVVSALANYMDVPIDRLHILANEGAITANVIKTAVGAAAVSTDRAFNELPLAFSQAASMIYTLAIRAFRPVADAITIALNNIDFDGLMKGAYQAMAGVGFIIAAAITGFTKLEQVISKSLGYAFSWLSAVATIAGNALVVVLGLVFAAVLGLAAGFAILNARLLYNMTLSVLARAIETAWARIIGISKAAMAAYQSIVLTVAAAKWWWTIATGGATIAQTLLAIATWAAATPILTIAAIIIGVMVAALTLWGLASLNLRSVFANVIDSMIDICEGGVNTMIEMINKLVDIVNKSAGWLNSFFGTNIGTLDYVAKVDFQDAKKWSNYVREGTLMKNLAAELPSMLDIDKVDPANAQTARNTKGIKDAMGILDEDLKYMRDIAEREYISNTKYTNVKIDMSGMSTTVNNKGDLHGMVDQLAGVLQERIAVAAEGLYE